MTMLATGSVRVAVVGVDGSPASLTALEWACQTVGPDGVVHAVHAIEPWRELVVAAAQVDSAALVARAHAQLDSWTVNGARPSAEVIGHVIESDPAHGLLAMADNVEADVVVTGAHSGVSPFGMLGHVASALVAQTPVPFVLVGANPVGGRTNVADDEKRLRRGVVVGVGRGPATVSAVAWAAGFARHHALALTLVRSIPERLAFGPDGVLDAIAYYLDPDVLDRWAAEDLADLAHEIEREPDDAHGAATDSPVAVDWAVRRGAIGRRLVEAAATADLLVIGRHEGFGDPTTSRLLHYSLLHSTCPVVVVPACDAAKSMALKPSAR